MYLKNYLETFLIHKLFVPESRLYAEFIDGLHYNAQVMTKHLTKHFVGLRDYRFASESLAKLRFNHAECRLHITALMVMLHKPFLIVMKLAEKAFPGIAAPSVQSGSVRAKR